MSCIEERVSQMAPSRDEGLSGLQGEAGILFKCLIPTKEREKDAYSIPPLRCIACAWHNCLPLGSQQL